MQFFPDPQSQGEFANNPFLDQFWKNTLRLLIDQKVDLYTEEDKHYE